MNDWRLPAIAAGAWAGGLLGPELAGPWGSGSGPPWSGWLLLAVVMVSVLMGVWLRRRTPAWAALTWVVVACGLMVAFVAATRMTQVNTSPVAALAEQRAQVSMVVQVTDDPRTTQGPFGPMAVIRATAVEVTGRGDTYRLRTPVVIIAQPEWGDLPLGGRAGIQGRLAPADGDVAALLSASSEPELRAEPDIWWRMADAVRSSMREVVRERPPDQRALLPALVDGDDQHVAEDLADDFATTGLTHLMAVSGTNLTILLSFLLAAARWAGVRGQWLMVVGACGVVGFILLARTEPSVIRAAAMGTIGMIALTVGRNQALRTLAGAVVALLLIAPSMAHSVGFALSVSATFGIVVWSPRWRDALAHWMPRWLAEAIAVPTAAQLACTPLIAAISGQVSLVAVVANMIVEPVVGPATILGLVAALVGLVWTPLGVLIAWPASMCVGWIALVARRGADLPGAEIGWGTSWPLLVVLVAITAAIVWAGPRLMGNRRVGVAIAAVLVAVLVARVPGSAIPQRWVVAACAVGQGDGLLLNAGGGAAVVIDAGSDPELIDACLDRLHITSVPLLVITHLHADHVAGVAGVLDGRSVGQAVTTGLRDPPGAASTLADAVGAHPKSVAQGDVFDVGQVRIQVLWPRSRQEIVGPGDGSTANDASVVMLATVEGVRILLTGDIEPPGQAALARDYPALRADVLKVPHHGSRYQSLPWITSIRAGVGLVSVGADNDYGHPNDELLSALESAGTRVWRTDLDGTVVVARTADGIAVTTD